MKNNENRGKHSEFVVNYFEAFKPGPATMEALFLLDAILAGDAIRIVEEQDGKLVQNSGYLAKALSKLNVNLVDEIDNVSFFIFFDSDLNEKQLRTIAFNLDGLADLKERYDDYCEWFDDERSRKLYEILRMIPGFFFYMFTSSLKPDGQVKILGE